MSETGFFTARDGAKLCTRSWLAPGNALGHVVLIHGFGEHAGRYEHVGEFLNSLGLSVYGYDHRYHGQSDGERGLILAFDHLLNDLDDFVDHIRPRFDGKAPFFLGHSMGGLVLARYAASRQPETAGLVFSGILLEIPDSVNPVLLALAPLLSKLFPRIPAATLETAALSRDPKVVQAYESDPLVYHGKIKARTGTELNLSVQKARAECHAIRSPAYILHGEDDRLAPVGGSKYLHEKIASQDKTLCLYKGGYHEQFNDLERDKVLNAVGAWLSKRIAT